MTSVAIAATAAALLLGVALAFQISLALGAPLGEATMGGRARTVDGVLAPGFRLLAAASALLLAIAAWVVLARAGVVDAAPVNATIVVWGTVAVAAFMGLNTLSNLSGRHPLERWGMGSITLLTTVLVAYVALAAPAI